MARFHDPISHISHFPDTKQHFDDVVFENSVRQFLEAEKRFDRYLLGLASLLTSLRPNYRSL